MSELEPRKIHALSDRELLRRVDELVADFRRTTAELVAHLVEVERRDLHLVQGYPSLYAYCTGQLRLDAAVALLRIRAARLARRFPRVLTMLAEGQIHLSGLALLSHKLTRDNHHKLLDAASGKTKREIESLLVCRFPQVAAPDRIRKLPTKAVEREETLPLIALASGKALVADEKQSEPSLKKQLPNPALAFGAPLDRIVRRPKPCRPVTPITGSLYKVQFTASQRLIRKLNTVRALASHRNPKGDLEPLFDQALTLLLEQLEKQRFGRKKRKKKNKPASRPGGSQTALSGKSTPAQPAPTAADSTASGKSTQSEFAEESADSAVSGKSTQPGGRQTARRSKESESRQRAEPPAESALSGESIAGRTEQASGPATRPTSRHIPNEVRRRVFERDGGRCTFVGADGHRCGATHFIEFEHKKPWSRGGDHSVSNVVLLCRAHNQLRARQEFPLALDQRRCE